MRLSFSAVWTCITLLIYRGLPNLSYLVYYFFSNHAGHTIQEATEDGESLLSLACSAGYYELAEVLLRMRASVEDRGMKGQSNDIICIWHGVEERKKGSS